MIRERIFRFLRNSAAASALLGIVFLEAMCESGGAGGDNSCVVNADCADSPAADEIRQIKCESEVYCQAGTCKGECVEMCQPVRSDVNPCAGGRLCAPYGFGGSFCSMLPVPCSSVADCPVYLPPSEGGTSAWSCTASVCSNPGWTYATH